MKKNSLIFLFLTMILFPLFSLNAGEYFEQQKKEYSAKKKIFSSDQIKDIFELSLLFNDYKFCRSILNEYCSNSGYKYNEDLFILFLRFAYASNDKEILNVIIKALPQNIKTNLYKTHQFFLDIIKSETYENWLFRNYYKSLTILPQVYNDFYIILLRNEDFYVFTAPLDFSEDSKNFAFVVTNTAPQDYDKAETASVEPKEPKEQKVITEDLNKSTAKDQVPAPSVVIQVGSFEEKENADDLMKELKLRNIIAEISEKEIQGRNYFRVVVPVPSNYTLEEYQIILLDLGFAGFRYYN